MSAHVRAAAVRTLPQGAGERAVCQVHRRAADPALAALLPEADAPPASTGRAAAAEQCGGEVTRPAGAARALRARTERAEQRARTPAPSARAAPEPCVRGFLRPAPSWSEVTSVRPQLRYSGFPVDS